jgi:hypothetical protein
MEQVITMELTTIEENPTRYEELSLLDRQLYWNAYLIRLVEYNNEVTCPKHNSQDALEDEIFKVKKILRILKDELDNRTIPSGFCS